MIGDVTEGIAKDASLGDRPVAGKTGTSENFFDAWFIGYTPELVTGTWMGYAEGGDTLEYVLDYARKLHGLPGGITPAEIWKSYTQEILRGEPVEQFEGVEIPREEDDNPGPAAAGPTTREPGATTRDPLAGGRRAVDGGIREPSRAQRRTAAGPASAASPSASASSVSPARTRRAAATRSRDARTGNAPSSASPSSASPR
jgi:penicillin-binding protein 1A